MLVKCYRCGEVFDVPEPVPETFTCPRCHSALTLAEGGGGAATVAVPIASAIGGAVLAGFIMGKIPPKTLDDVRDVVASITASGFVGLLIAMATKR